jgi:hypothetical protein
MVFSLSLGYLELSNRSQEKKNNALQEQACAIIFILSYGTLVILPAPLTQTEALHMPRNIRDMSIGEHCKHCTAMIISLLLRW